MSAGPSSETTMPAPHCSSPWAPVGGVALDQGAGDPAGAQRDVGRVGGVADIAADDVVAAGRGRADDGDPHRAGPVQAVAGEAVRGPASLEEDPELAEEVHGQILDPVAVGPDQMNPAPGEGGDRSVPDGDVVVAAVVDPDLVGSAARDDLAADGVPVQVDGDAVGPNHQPVTRAVEQVGGEGDAPGDHRPQPSGWARAGPAASTSHPGRSVSRARAMQAGRRDRDDMRCPPT
jgi:hypothetical protein